MGASYKVEVQADHTGNWNSNALRFSLHEDATLYGHGLYQRWTSVREFRVVQSDDPPTHRFDRGSARAVEIKAEKGGTDDPGDTR